MGIETEFERGSGNARRSVVSLRCCLVISSTSSRTGESTCHLGVCTISVRASSSDASSHILALCDVREPQKNEETWID
jgi:hypothetical protein